MAGQRKKDLATKSTKFTKWDSDFWILYSSCDAVISGDNGEAERVRVDRSRPPRRTRPSREWGDGVWIWNVWLDDACMKTRWIVLFLFFLGGRSQAEMPVRLSLAPVSGMTRADLYHFKTVRPAKAVLVLCPGCNGNGEGLVTDPVWQEFANKRDLGLVGLSFASDLKDIHNGKGYYYAGNGSGKLLLDGIHKLFNRELPFLLYGFSGGAHFTARFVEWQPERVIAWCAYSAGWWDEPKSDPIMPPGIVACGESDERLGASLIYFKQGRAAGKPWLWIGIPNNGHWPDKRVDSFVRDYFEAMLGKPERPDPARTGLWLDIDKRAVAEAYVIRQYPSLSGWLPDAGLFEVWRALNDEQD